MSGMQYFHDGGPVMYILLGLSIFAVAIVLLKLFEFRRLKLDKTLEVDRAFSFLAENNVVAARDVLVNSPSPVARIMRRAFTCFEDLKIRKPEIESELRRVGSKHVREMESKLRSLGAIAHLSPLLGLLGTVLGMISAFRQLEGTGMKVNPALLAGGIWEALLTTAFGLAIAIPSMAAYYYFEGQVDKVSAQMKDAVIRVFVFYARPEHESKPGTKQSADIRELRA